jgi:hypothetical protein
MLVERPWALSPKYHSITFRYTVNHSHFTNCLAIRAMLLACISTAALGQDMGVVSNRAMLLPIKDVAIMDSFWAPKLKVYREKTIPHSWFYMQWEMRSLRKAAGEKVGGELNGTWGEANLHKFLETAAYALAMGRDAALEEKVDEVIRLLAAGQQSDGYLHVYVTNNGKSPWDPAFLDGSTQVVR